MYTIRPMEGDDIPAVIALAKSNQSRSRYADLTYDDDGAIELCELSLVSEDVQIFVVTTDMDEVVGAVGAVVNKMPWFKELFASEQFLALHPDHRGFKQAVMLLRAYKNWAFMRGAKVLNVLADNSDETDERTKLLYQRVGFKPTGYALAMRST